VKEHGQVKAIIGPHAGYAYSGPTAAFAYKHLVAKPGQKVFLLGPSHHVYLKGVALTGLDLFRTPLGDIKVDQPILAALRASKLFKELTKAQEEDEHSLELHLPYIRQVLGEDFTLIPLMVGDMSPESRLQFAAALQPYFDSPDSLFIISTDFCHWGKRFGFTPYDKEQGEIHESIEAMDRAGIKLLEGQDLGGWTAYLKDTENTVCGRNPVTLFLQLACGAARPLRTRLVEYAQSERVSSMKGSSVSYAALVCALAD
jgi:AmmeMemoRadiSam system protein B